jgi:hypothetical protein
MPTGLDNSNLGMAGSYPRVGKADRIHSRDSAVLNEFVQQEQV